MRPGIRPGPHVHSLSWLLRARSGHPSRSVLCALHGRRRCGAARRVPPRLAGNFLVRRQESHQRSACQTGRTPLSVCSGPGAAPRLSGSNILPLTVVIASAVVPLSRPTSQQLAACRRALPRSARHSPDRGGTAVECAALVPAASVRAGQARRSVWVWTSARLSSRSLEGPFDPNFWPSKSLVARRGETRRGAAHRRSKGKARQAQARQGKPNKPTTATSPKPSITTH